MPGTNIRVGDSHDGTSEGSHEEAENKQEKTHKNSLSKDTVVTMLTIFGGVAGFVVVFLIIWCFCYSRKKMLQIAEMEKNFDSTINKTLDAL